MATVTSSNVNLMAGESLSAGLNTGTSLIAAILVPANWEPIANLTFQVSADNVTYCDVFDSMGNEIMIAAKPGTAIVIEAGWMEAVGWIKFRSGGRDNPVVQTAARTLTVFLK